jgi:diguanylate cyclase
VVSQETAVTNPAEEHAADRQALSASAFEHLPVEAAVLDRSGVVVLANDLWRAGRNPPVGSDFVDQGDADDGEVRAMISEGVGRVMTGRSSRVELEVPDHGSGTRRWLLLLLGGVAHDGAVVVKVDVTRSREVLDLVAESSMRDGVTGLPNRSLIEDRIESAVARAERGTSAPVVLFLDLDRFKEVNDVHGHGMGDRVLMTVSQRLSASLRALDTFGRWGGDEFVAVIEVEAGGDWGAAVGVIDRMLKAVAAPVELGGAELSIDVSIGAVVVRPGDSVRTLIALADAAMYEAKQSGEHVVVTRRDAGDLVLDLAEQRRRQPGGGRC